MNTDLFERLLTQLLEKQLEEQEWKSSGVVRAAERPSMSA